MKNDTSRPRVRHPVAAQPTVTTRPPARAPSSRGTPSHGTPRTRLIRFRLNPRSDGDQQILRWLAQVAPYYRADAIRTALLTHILRRQHGNERASGAPPATETVPTAAPTAAQKLEKMFSA